MERLVNRLFFFFVVLFLALVAQLTYVQVYAAPKLRVHPSNTRALDAQMRVQRGLIVSADGVVLAQNRQEGSYYLREYPRPELVSPWLGYADLRYGKAGVERVYDAELTGETGVPAARNFLDRLTGRPQRGADLHVTIDTRVQAAAVTGLGDRVGAVVALDPRTGEVLALASSPSYDPNQLAADWKTLNQNPGRPLVDRAIQGLYPPGSTFKVIVAGAGIEEGVVTPQTTFTDDGSWLAGGYRVNNYGGTAYGQHTFTQAFAESINTTFAKLGVQLGAETLSRYAEAFGFNARPPWDLGGAAAFFPPAGGMDTAHVAQASTGQGKVLATPLEMALAAAGIANGGVIMRPTIVKEWRDYRQTVFDRASPKAWLTPISAQTAATELALMVKVVQEGTGTKAALPNVQVAGKTGTAEVEGGVSHAWFIGFAPADHPQVAVAVLVEHGGTGGAIAAPIAASVIAAALGH